MTTRPTIKYKIPRKKRGRPPTVRTGLAFPTMEQVKSVWESMDDPTGRKVQKVLAEQGFTLAHNTIYRWQASGWRGPSNNGRFNELRPIVARGGTSPDLKAAISDVVEKDDLLIHERMISDGLTYDETGNVIIPKLDVIGRILELSGHDAAKLGETTVRAGMILEILVLEQMQRRSELLALIPKDMGPFLLAMVESRKEGRAFAAAAASGASAKLINSMIDDDMPMAAHPTSEAIRRFRVDHGIGVVNGKANGA